MASNLSDPVASPAAAPSADDGTRTFLFTDIEGSTRLLQALGRTYPDVLLEHDRILTEVVERHGGRVFGHQGDAVFAMFDDAAAAIGAALAGQRQLAGHAWPGEAAVRVRMGVHAGKVTERDGTLVGLPLHEVARIAAAGHGGQVLVSDAARALAARGLPDGVLLRDLGAHRLRDLPQPERLYQVVAPDLTTDFPPIRTLSSRRGNLPPQVTTFVRRSEVERSIELLATARLLTLTGPGGTGKTRLAIEVAQALADSYPDGAWFVALDSVSDPTLVPSAIARSLGIESGADAPLERVVRELREQRALLVLDNFEQVVDASAVVGRLLREAPGVTMIVTSRIVLRVSGEQEFPVPPLDVPAAAAGDPDAIGRSDAVRLFVERAQAIDPGFRLDAGNAPAVAEIVSRLDGLPLAIELAAARIRVLPVEAIRSRLDQRLSLLTGGARDLPARQQTLRGAIDWSHDLLSEGERRLFARLAVFSGGAGLAEIAAVCGPDADLEVDLLDGLASLAEKSLVQPISNRGDPRFGMLATIREYALERLEARGEAGLIRARHVAAYLAIAESCAPHLTGREAERHLERLAADHDNLRAAVEHAVEDGDVESAIRLGTALWRFWQRHGDLLEARERLSRIMTMAGVEDAAPSSRAALLGAAGSIGYWRGDPVETLQLYEAALEAARASGEPALIAEATLNLGFQPLADRSLARHRYARGRPQFEEALRLYTELGDERGKATAMWALAIADLAEGDLLSARHRFDESLAMYRRLDEPFWQGWALHMRGLVDLLDGRLDDATRGYHAAARLLAGGQDLSAASMLLLDFALIARYRGEMERYWLLAGAADAAAGRIGSDLSANVDDFLEVDPPTRPLDDPEAAALWDRGAGMSAAAAMAVALGDS